MDMSVFVPCLELWEGIGVIKETSAHNRWCAGVWVLCSHDS